MSLWPDHNSVVLSRPQMSPAWPGFPFIQAVTRIYIYIYIYNKCCTLSNSEVYRSGKILVTCDVPKSQ